MAKDFILIKEQRVRKTMIKKYSPLGEKKLNVYFNVSRYKVELETYSFESKEEREDMIELLDNIFLY